MIIKENRRKICLSLLVAIFIFFLPLSVFSICVHVILEKIQYIYEPLVVLQIIGLFILSTVFFAATFATLIYAISKVKSLICPSYIELFPDGIKASGIKEFIKWYDIEEIDYFDINKVHNLLNYVQKVSSINLTSFFRTMRIRVMLSDPFWQKRMSVIILKKNKNFYRLSIDSGLTDYAQTGIVEVINLYRQDKICKKDNNNNNNNNNIHLHPMEIVLFAILIFLFFYLIVDAIQLIISLFK